MEITFYEERPDLDTYYELRESVDWNNFCSEQSEKALNNSTYFVLARDKEFPVVMGRTVGDGMYYVIVDVIVRPEYQGKGLVRL